jgi:hypothetical protein
VMGRLPEKPGTYTVQLTAVAGEETTTVTTPLGPTATVTVP